MAIEEKENEQKTPLDELIELVEKDPIPTNVFTIEDTDPLVLLGKLNEIEAYLRGIKGIISTINDKSNDALTHALEAVTTAKQALEGGVNALASSNTALETANTAIDTANTSLETAQNAKETAEGIDAKATSALDTAGNALDQANSAHDTAGEALDEAVDAMEQAKEAIKIAQNALEQVTEGLGTKVFDSHGNLLNEAKFSGHNGINVDMSEDDHTTFDIRLDNTITTAIEETHRATETNKASIVELADMLSATEDTAQQALEGLQSKVNKSGDTITGKLIVENGTKTAIIGNDTRNVDSPPTDYQTTDKSISYITEFKDTSKIGLKDKYSNVPNYTLVITYTPWRDASGGRPVQIAINTEGYFIRTSNISTWSAWQEFLVDYDILNKLYPVGFIYISTSGISPAQIIGGTWKQLNAGVTLWTTPSNTNSGGYIDAGLPNLKGVWQRGNGTSEITMDASRVDGVFIPQGNYLSSAKSYGNSSGNYPGYTALGFNANKANSIYGNSTTVQPPAYKVYMWERINPSGII